MIMSMCFDSKNSERENLESIGLDDLACIPALGEHHSAARSEWKMASVHCSLSVMMSPAREMTHNANGGRYASHISPAVKGRACRTRRMGKKDDVTHVTLYDMWGPPPLLIIFQHLAEP